ncbi:MAG: isoaspartyl peptidase/L-asparaginase, partial [bacterium]
MNATPATLAASPWYAFRFLKRIMRRQEDVMTVSRRDFLTTAVVGSLSLGLQGQEKPGGDSQAAPGKRPIVISSANGAPYLDDAYKFLKTGGDTLDAAMKVVKGPEDDPTDDSVGLGGLPNEEGVVELDACCMHGPTRRAGSVGGLRNIKNASQVAKAVMEHTGHVMLVGEGAERFAVAQGFPRENLLTERSRKIWLLWKEYHSTDDWWGPSLSSPQWQPPDTKPTADVWR